MKCDPSGHEADGSSFVFWGTQKPSLEGKVLTGIFQIAPIINLIPRATIILYYLIPPHIERSPHIS